MYHDGLGEVFCDVFPLFLFREACGCAVANKLPLQSPRTLFCTFFVAKIHFCSLPESWTLKCNPWLLFGSASVKHLFPNLSEKSFWTFGLVINSGTICLDCASPRALKQFSHPIYGGGSPAIGEVQWPPLALSSNGWWWHPTDGDPSLFLIKF